MNIIFLLMLLSLLVSQSLMDLMSFVVIVASLWGWKKQLLINGRKFQFYRIGLEKLWLAWILVFVVGLFLAPFSSAELAAHPNSPWLFRLSSLGELKWIINFYFFVWFFAWVLPWEVNTSTKSVPSENIFQYVWGGLLIFSAYALFALAFDFDLAKQQPLSDPGRVGGLFDDPMTFAHVYGQFFVLIFFITLNRLLEKIPTSTFKNILVSDGLLFLTTLFSGLAVLLSMTRGVWIGVFIGLLVPTFLYRKKLGMIFLGVTTSLFFLIFFSWPKFHERVVLAFSSSSYDGERIWLWMANWKMFLDHPFFGIGYGIYKWRLREYFDLMGAPAEQFESHAHNQYLHFLAGTGLLGLLCFLIFIGFNLWTTWKLIVITKTSSLKGMALGLLGSQICFLVAALTESNFERAKVRWTYLVFAALGIAALKINSHSATSRWLRADSEKVDPEQI